MEATVGTQEHGAVAGAFRGFLRPGTDNFRDGRVAIAYIKRPEYRPLWQRWLAAHNLPPNLAQEIIADVCRDDLLFEIELDAVTRLR